MNPSKLFLTLGAAAALSFSAEAAISVTGAGAGPFDFSAPPASPGDFSTLAVGNSSMTYETVAALDAAVMATDASTVTTALGTSAGNPPGTAGIARHSTTLQALVTRPTGVDYTLLMATLVNAAGGTISHFTLTYDFMTNNVATAVAAEAIPGHRVFFSVTGAPGSWQPVPALSGLTDNTLGASAIISGISWPSGANAYVLWADDNSLPNDDWGNIIDNLAITGVSTTIEPTTIAITRPTNGHSVAVCADLTVATTTTGVITNVAFLLDGVFFTNDTTFPYGGTVTVPVSTPLGSHTLTAVATDNTGAMVTSSPVTLHVLANTPPTINITNTFSGTITGTTFLVGSPIVVQAGFSDDDMITNISWFVDNVLYITNRINGSWTYVDSLAGTHVLKGEAADRKGHITMATRTVTVTNPPSASYTLLVTNGSEWRYYVPSTSEPPLDVLLRLPWYDIDYDDTGFDWASAFAELGNGDTADGYPERTMIDIGPAGARYSAMYFRRTFNVSNPSLYPTISLRLLRDDGAVVYLNGGPVWTNNMVPSTLPITYTNLAAASDDGLNYQILNLPNPSGAPVVVSGANIVAVEVHQQALTSSDLSFDMMIWGSTVPNMPPSVTLTNPLPGSNVMVGTFVDVGAIAADTDGTVAQVEFFDNGILRMTDTAAPYGFTLSDLTAGAHTLRAVAFDNNGSNSTSSVMIVVTNPPALTAILTNGSDWKYLDTGVDQGTAWTALGFDDTGWASGPAELGYGDLAGETRPERTVVSFGPDPNLKYRTTYFRKKITVAAPIEFGRLRLDALRDDGIVVHINGSEVFRNNFTNMTTPILFGDFADATIGGVDEMTYISTNIAASTLVVGMNIIAVEIHQVSTNSSDISFDLMLWGAGPQLTITAAGGNYTVRWNNAPNYRLQQSLNISSPANWTDIASDPASPYTQPLPAAPSQKFFRLRHR